MGILHTTKVGSTEMAKALGISLSRLKTLQKNNKFTNGSDYYTMATGKNASGKRIIWSKERAEQTFFKNKKRKPEPPKVTRWN
jgi:hypothetical protein|tara:strand:+ start:910 stop:1158 length:249 start_codon:yes stop_codon:yes gene_type:complete